MSTDPAPGDLTTLDPAALSTLVRGAIELERTERGLLPHRLPARARVQAHDEQLTMAEAQPAGVRLILRTAATVLELDAVRTKNVYVGAPERPDGSYDLLVDGVLTARGSVDGGDVLLIDMGTGTRETRRGPAGTVRFAGLPAREKRVEIWLPHTEITELVALRADAPVVPVPAAGRTWLHHGSSISHGSNAASPSTTWPALAATSAGVDLVNLGFGGGALLDPFTARTMRDTPADLVSVKTGINLVNLDGMRLRTFTAAVHGFLDTIRDGHPTTPLLVVSPLWCAIHEDTPGPAAPDFDDLADGFLKFKATGDPAAVAQGALTLRTIRAELTRIVAERAGEDPNLAYLDGRDLYGEADAVTLPLPDALHPDPATHELIGARFAERAFGPAGFFGPA